MFLTAMAANPLIAKLAHDVAGVDLTWTSWAIAAIVPGLVSLIITPLVIYKLYPPEIKETPDAAKIATEKLKEMGPFKKSELSMVIVFLLVLALWIFWRQLQHRRNHNRIDRFGRSFIIAGSDLG